MRRIVYEESVLPLLLRERAVVLRAKRIAARHEATVRRVLTERNPPKSPSSDHLRARRGRPNDR
jgi:hypothetical protein